MWILWILVKLHNFYFPPPLAYSKHTDNIVCICLFLQLSPLSSTSCIFSRSPLLTSGSRVHLRSWHFKTNSSLLRFWCHVEMKLKKGRFFNPNIAKPLYLSPNSHIFLSIFIKHHWFTFSTFVFFCGFDKSPFSMFFYIFLFDILTL